MALTVTSRGTGTHNTGATTLVPDGRSATLAVNSLGVLCISLDNAGSLGSTLIAPDTWTDAKSNLWTLRANALYDNGAASAGIEMAIYTAPIVTQLLTSDAGTMTWKTGVSPVAKVWTWYEVIPSNGIAPAYLEGGTIAGATAANATVATANNVNIGDAVIAGYFSENTAAVTGDSDSTNGTWTAQQTTTIGTTTAGVRIASQQKVQTTAASTQSYDVTVSSQDRIAGYIVVREIQAQNPQPTAAALVASGATPTVTVTSGVIAIPTAASLVATGDTPTVATTSNVLAQPTAASLTVTGATPIVATPVLSVPGSASLTLTAATPVVTTTANVLSQPTAASLTLTGATPSIRLDKISLPAAAALAFSMGTPTVTRTDNILVLPIAAALLLSGAVPVVTNSGAPPPASPLPQTVWGSRQRQQQVLPTFDIEADDEEVLLLSLLI